MDILTAHVEVIKSELDLVKLYASMAQMHAYMGEYEEALDYDKKSMDCLQNAAHLIKKHLL